MKNQKKEAILMIILGIALIFVTLFCFGATTNGKLLLSILGVLVSLIIAFTCICLGIIKL